MKRNRYFYQLSSLWLILMAAVVISGCSGSTLTRPNGSSLPQATATQSTAVEATAIFVTTSVPTATVVGDANNGHGNDVDGCDEGNPGNGASCAGTATPVTTNNNGQGKK